MTNLLENVLVKKYFGDFSDHAWITNYPFPEKEFMALRVLQAMQEPIRKGERYLWWSIDYPGTWVEQIQTSSDEYEYHPFKLRLPDRFQKKECDHHAYRRECTLCGITEMKTDWMTFDWPLKPAPEPHWHSQLGVTCDKCEKPFSAVEQKIKQMADAMSCGGCFADAEGDLRTLVKLAQKEKGD